MNLVIHMPLTNRMAEMRARVALQEAGLPHDGPLVRANSTRNEVFIASEHVIRFNQQPNQRLKREAEICEILPPQSWTPQVVAHGGRPGADYLIVEKRPGASLSRIWPQMSDGQRRQAIHQFTLFLKDLHQIPNCDRIPEVDSPPHLLGGGYPVEALLAGLQTLGRTPNVDSGLTHAAREMVLDAEDALADYNTSRLIHGDLSLENVLWDGRQITAIVDFEWCRGGPADLDLDVLSRYFAIPEAHVSAEAEEWQHTEDYYSVPLWMSEVYPELFAHPNLADRLLIYAMAFEVRDLLENPPPANKRDLNKLHPYYRLHHLVATGGHVEKMISHLGRQFQHS